MKTTKTTDITIPQLPELMNVQMLLPVELWREFRATAVARGLVAREITADALRGWLDQNKQ